MCDFLSVVCRFSGPPQNAERSWERFGQDDLKGVAKRLEAMLRSIDVLKDMPEADDRAATLKELQEKLEALLKPNLLQVRGEKTIISFKYLPVLILEGYLLSIT